MATDSSIDFMRTVIARMREGHGANVLIRAPEDASHEIVLQCANFVRSQGLLALCGKLMSEGLFGILISRDDAAQSGFFLNANAAQDFRIRQEDCH